MGGSSSAMYNPSDAKAAEIDNMALSTNVVVIPYHILLSCKNQQNQLAQSCRGCGAHLNIYSKLDSQEEYLQKLAKEEALENLNDIEKAEREEANKGKDYIKGKFIKDLGVSEVAWICEFCEVHNRLPASTSRPMDEYENYLLKKSIKVEAQAESLGHEESKDGDETTLVFCIDVSGSMGCTHEVHKNGKMEYVPRLQLITDAVLKQLQEIRKDHPQRKVGLILFGSYVTLLGDCSVPEAKIFQALDTFDGIMNSAQLYTDKLLNKSIQENYNLLEKVIKELEVGGGTALGPALLSSLTLIGKERKGSQVIICTDGLANIGAGNLESAAEIPKAKVFYDQVCDLAVENGTSVSILTVKGQACKVDALGPITDRTAGQIIRVDPTNFDLSAMTSNSVIATNVRLKAIIHEGLGFKNLSSGSVQISDSIIEQNVGSVSSTNEVYFEYRMKNVQELKDQGINLDEVSWLPIQAQISYTDVQGNERILVVTRKQNLTKDQKEAEKGIKADILTGYVQKQSANLVLDGRVEEAKKQNEEWSKMIEKAANNVDLDEDNKKVFEGFKAQNAQLQSLMKDQGAGMSAADRDDVTSKLYEIKQQKHSKY